EAYYFSDLGPGLDAYASMFKAETHDTDSIANLYIPIRDMVMAITTADDRSVVADVGSYLDLTEMMKYLAVESFLVEWDGITGNWGVNNFYLYRFRSGAP